MPKQFRLLLTGKAHKKTMGIYLFSIIIFFFTMCKISQVLFPGGYSILYYYISDQGCLAENPQGFIFFSIGAITTGLLLIPYFIYIWRHIKNYLTLISNLATLFGLIGSIGLALVGMIPKDFKHPHDIAADLAFGGYALSAFFLLFVFIRIRVITKKFPSVLSFLLSYGVMFALIATEIVFQSNSKSLELILNINPRYFSSTFWQWMQLFTVLYWMISMYMILMPDMKKENFKKE
ncbi:MAG: DUF998 domain-containing protein [Promethearchaeota archaeon]